MDVETRNWIIGNLPIPHFARLCNAPPLDQPSHCRLYGICTRKNLFNFIRYQTLRLTRCSSRLINMLSLVQFATILRLHTMVSSFVLSSSFILPNVLRSKNTFIAAGLVIFSCKTFAFTWKPIATIQYVLVIPAALYINQP